MVLRAGSAPHPAASEPGLHKTAMVFSGTLLVTGPYEAHRIESRQSAQWSADVPGTYTAIGKQDVATSLLLR